LAHNPLVNRELVGRGFVVVAERDEVATPGVLVTAHGTSDRERVKLMMAGNRVIDTTCPLVRRAHDAAVGLQREGFHVLVIGQRNHVEVRGFIEDLESFDVLESSRDVRQWEQGKLGIITQTTCPERDAMAIVERVRRMNAESEIRFVDTICQPTRDRQAALEKLLDEVDVLVVVGGRNSNNTRRLVRRALVRGVPSVHVEDVGELEESLFWPGMVVGLTAGTSTLPETIAAVKGKLEKFEIRNSKFEANSNIQMIETSLQCE